MARSKMKRFVIWIPFVLYGVSATAPLVVADVPITPAARRNAALFDAAGHPGLDHGLFRPEEETGHLSESWHQMERRQTQAAAPLQFTPVHLAQLHSQLQIVYAQLSAFSAAQNTGILNNLLRLLGGVVPPLSEVLETLRAVLIGDSVTNLNQLAIAQAIGKTTYNAHLMTSY